MANLIFILSLLVLWHFIYDGIILPTIRLNLRYKLFTLRDRIRTIKNEKQDKVDNQVFHYLNNSINVSIRYLSSYNIDLLVKANREFKKNPDLNKRVNHNIKFVHDCSDNEVQNIYLKEIKYCALAFISNSGSWLLYFALIIIPILIFSMILYFIVKGLILPIKIYCENWFKTIQNISFTPEHEFPKIYGNLIFQYNENEMAVIQ